MRNGELNKMSGNACGGETAVLTLQNKLRWEFRGRMSSRRMMGLSKRSRGKCPKG